MPNVDYYGTLLRRITDSATGGIGDITLEVAGVTPQRRTEMVLALRASYEAARQAPESSTPQLALREAMAQTADPILLLLRRNRPQLDPERRDLLRDDIKLHVMRAHLDFMESLALHTHEALNERKRRRREN
jgi:hypothetical protein